MSRQTEHFDPGFILGHRICVTGRLVSMTHAEFAELVTQCGGVFVRKPTRKKMTLVIGEQGWPADRNGSPTRVFARAQELCDDGCDIDFLQEDDFFNRLGMTETTVASRRHHTMIDLVRILNVTRSQLRRWVHLGIIKPVEIVHRLAYFDFHEIASAKRLVELIAAGVTLENIRRGLEQIEGWFPRKHTASFSQLAMLEQDGKLLVGLNGNLFDPSGQKLFDFEESDSTASTIQFESPSASTSIEQLFDDALAFEDAGQFQQAAERYRSALALDPTDPVLNFNLGNTLFTLKEYVPAIAYFQTALGRDPQYAEAWNNLGSVFVQIEDWEQACNAFEQAVSAVPRYAEAHFNLAGVLTQLGRLDEAQRHTDAYERSSSTHGQVVPPFRIAGRSESEERSQ